MLSKPKPTETKRLMLFAASTLIPSKLYTTVEGSSNPQSPMTDRKGLPQVKIPS